MSDIRQRILNGFPILIILSIVAYIIYLLIVAFITNPIIPATILLMIIASYIAGTIFDIITEWKNNR